MKFKPQTPYETNKSEYTMIGFEYVKRKETQDMVYLVFIHKDGGLLYGGYFSTREKAETVCKEWNEANENKNQFADFINVTDEKGNAFILGVR